MMMRMMAKTSHLLEVAEPVVMANITISVEEDVRIAWKDAKPALEEISAQRLPQAWWKSWKVNPPVKKMAQCGTKTLILVMHAKKETT